MAHRAITRKRPESIEKVGRNMASVAYAVSPFGQVESIIGAMANPESGIKFVLGIAKRAGQKVSEVQSVLFDRVKWTADSAKDWLHEHGFTSSGKDEGATFWRFRQSDPNRYKEFRTVVPGTRKNPSGEGSHYAILDGVRVGLGTGNKIIFSTDWEHLWELAAKGDRRLIKQSGGPSTYGHTDLLYIGTQAKPYPSYDENPTPSEAIESYDEHLKTTTDPEFQSASPDEQAAAMTVQDLAENPGYSDAAPDVKAEIESHAGTWFTHLAYPHRTRHTGGFDEVYAAAKEAAVSSNRPVYFGSYLTGREPQRLTGHALAVWPDGRITWASQVPLKKGNPAPAITAQYLAENPLEGEYSVYTDAGLIAFGVSLEHAREIAGKIRHGSAKIATTAGTVVEVVRDGAENPVHLQGVGSMRSIPASEAKPGMKIAYNYGYSTNILSIVPQEDSLLFTERSDQDGKEHTKLRRRSTQIVAYHPKDENPTYAWAVQEQSSISGWHTVSTWITHEAADKQAKELSEETRKTHRVMHKESGRVYQTFKGSRGENPAYGQIQGRDYSQARARSWIQEWYETASGDSRTRTAQLRKLRYQVSASGMGSQITPVGSVKMTLVDIRPGTSGDDDLNDVPQPAGGITRMNPEWNIYAQKLPSGKYGIFDRRTGEKVREVKTRSAALQVVVSMRAKSNPESAAADLYEEFHGQAPGETLEIVTERTEHGWLTQLGTLVELKVETMTKLDATLQFSKEAPELCSSEDGRQLYIEGGDQALDLKVLKMDGEKWEKDSMTIGVLVELTYRTKKGFHRFKTTDYFNKLGEESGIQPFLLYDSSNKLLSISGGVYRVEEPGIID